MKIPETAKAYQEQAKFRLVAPFKTLVCLAVNQDGHPQIWAKRLSNSMWILTNSQDGRCYMFKEDGLFGYTENREDIDHNSYPTLKDAIEWFNKFYK